MIKKEELRKIFTPEQYKVKIFDELGHIRKQCSKCGIFFWTLDPNRTTCGETECEGGYKFIGRKGPNWDFHQTINKLTKFFEKNGHTPIDSFPVVARWRKDLDFTIASIATLQPYVTGGLVDPPANPLTIPQPCLRFGGEFNDLDNIGRTGRHLSSFVMFGQHAFNSEKLTTGYWMDRCIELNYKFLTEELKVEPEEITYTENIWAGGGNFGPNLESMAYGTEIVNSVFMQYANTPSGYKEMDIKVIDVGWGAERVGWFSQGTPTIYESTFGPVWDYMLKESGITYNKKLVEDYAVLAGLLDVNEITDIKSARSGIANQLGMSLPELNTALAEVEALYAIGDHSRTFSFALADGAIPSNVGGGYNVRTVLRRIFTLKELLNLDIDVTELVNRQIQYVSQTYPRLRNVEDIVGTVLDVEYSRYNKTVANGQRYVKQLLKDKKKINTDKLIEIYESRGMAPETVSSIAEGMDVQIDVPGDFYNILGSRQHEAVADETEESAEVSIESIKDFVTEKRYYETPYIKTLDATVVAILDTGHVILDQTIFYPLGGGQAEDHGTLKFGRVTAKVIDVKKYYNAIVHKLDKKIKSLKVGSKVHITIDWERRQSLIRHHTAVHIVGGAAREVLGPHVWQAGADKTPEKARLDISHWENLSRETLDEIELIANSVVMDNRRLIKEELSRTEAEHKYGFTIYQGGAIPGKKLRIVQIPGIDTEACGGTHAESTGDIGYIRILGAERIQDGVVRITLTAGKKAVTTSQHNYNMLAQAADTFKVPVKTVPKTADRFFSEWKEQQKTIEKLTKDLAVALIPQAIANAKLLKKGSTKVKFIAFQHDANIKDLIILGEQIAKKAENTIAVILGKDGERAQVVVARTHGSSYNLNSIIRGIGKILGGGGGGKGDVISGGGSKATNIGQALANAEKIVIESL